MFKFITHRPLWVSLLAGLIIALILFFIFVFALKSITHHGESKTVPQVLGKTYEQAVEILENAGFEVQIQDSVYVDTTKPLVVLKQVPESDELVKVNRTVYLTINRSVPPLIEMPNLIGYSFRSAEMALKASNLRMGDTSFKPDFARNAVLEQRYHKGEIIASGTQVRMGTVVDLVLGDGVGDQQFVVPSLIGQTYCEAKSLLAAHGLAFGAVLAEGVSDTCNAYIYWQSPERYDQDRKFRYIRSGQLIDIRLQNDAPVIDSLRITAPPEDEED